MTETVLSVEQVGPGWMAHCSIHGPLGVIWAYPAVASFDAIGHGTHHHSPKPLGDARCWCCPAPATTYRPTGGGMIAVCARHKIGGP